ncbi:MAG TPA: CAP domain-containing protein, partial [Dehalococcoidia bacterium]
MTAERTGAKMEQMKLGSPQGSPLPFRLRAISRPALLLTLTATFALAAMIVFGARGTAADPSFDSEEQAFLTLINDYRAQNGRAPLTTDCRLNAAADWFANDMAIDNYWPSNHYDNEDPPRSPAQRASEFGFNLGGEIIAGGQISAKQALEAWQNSPGHNSVMLRDYVVIGIGRAFHPNAKYRWYWVADFAYYVPPPAQPQCGPPPTPPLTPSPTPVPTPVPTPSPTPVPTPSPTAEPTPQPTPEPLVWGDTDCDQQIGPLDSIRVLRLDAGLLTTTPSSCPPMGSEIFVNGVQY